uniref:Uncharacterized protein n=1 Tax=Aegilops tauschii subsp. strangulata TaxID=200361 RepID=A0A452ZPU2_AEGTS
PLMPTIEASHLKRRPAVEKEKVGEQLFGLQLPVEISGYCCSI